MFTSVGLPGTTKESPIRTLPDCEDTKDDEHLITLRRWQVTKCVKGVLFTPQSE